jgi:hypothetical protein
MRIDLRRLLLGGLVGGLVGNVIGFVGFGLLLGPRLQAEAVAMAPALEGRSMGGAAVATNIAAQFVTGLLLVWLYAAMLPRFGAGFRTAAMAAFVVWLCGLMFRVDWLLFGMMSPRMYVLAAGLALFQAMIVAWVGSLVYKER